MDVIELVKAAVFGVVEGITEWLPISSTGHMLLLNQFLTMNVSEDFWNMFLVVIQLGAILAVCVMFFHRLNPFSPKKSAGEKRDTWVLWAKTIVACIPAAVIGIPIDDWMEENLGSPFVIAAALIVYGIAFIVIETVRERRADRALEEGTSHGGKHFAVDAASAQLTRSELADADARVQSLEELGWKTAIGTFFLAIPVMVGASGLRLVKYFLAGNVLASTEAAILGVGCLVAFVVSLAVIKFLMEFVRRHDFKPFGWYRIVLGVAVIAWFALH